ncbi:2-keto-4-pentenoate hydratase [Sciscionella sediminilitoris]|uniref:2-keto-4-pentenoate hydratase n=1 Tax=Sciscionella sediminilitoris TaxID=1445613 RepID=UPI0004DFCD35|nr:hypothetical protein [Sciscionella sp. SE31]
MAIDIDGTTERLIAAQDSRSPVEKLLDEADNPTKADAFRVAQEVVRRRVAAGDAVAGFKLGNIAKAMQTMFGVDEPDYGYLLASQFRPENLTIDEKEFIEPFVEVEPAFVLKNNVGGPHVTAVDIIAATDFVVPALEIIDSRVLHWNISIYDTLADGGSCGAVIVGGSPRKLSEVDLADTPGEVRFDDEVKATGNTSAAYGNPIGALAWLCRRVAEYDVGLQAGQLILPGSILAAERLVPGHRVTGSFAGWGEVSFDYGNVK